MLKVELGFRLDRSFEYYDRLLRKNGLENDYNCLTHDIYYTNENLDNLTENEMKQKCVRLRNVDFNGSYQIQNNKFIKLDSDIILKEELLNFENDLIKKGFKKVFDTRKSDHHYFKSGMNSKVQLQEIEDIGLLVYYDNSMYYELSLEEQRKRLIDELNSYGFNFCYDNLGYDKLRSLYYKKDMFSLNQNG